MRLLIIGGTRFVGRHLVEIAVERGHEVTIVSRGNTAPGPSTNAEWIVADRRGGLTELAGRDWDAVVDTCGYRAEDVELTANALIDSVGFYAFVSTASVYPDHSSPGLTEDVEIKGLRGPSHNPSDPKKYGAMKAACEKVVRDYFPGSHLISRPSLIVGPFDPSGRFAYWPLRAQAGGNILAPEIRDEPIQYIDARDHANFVLHSIEERIPGTFNVATPPGTLSFGSYFDTCIELAKPIAADVTWVDELRLAVHVTPWQELPMWNGPLPHLLGTMLISTSAAERAGLKCRPMAESLLDVLNFERDRDETTRPEFLSREKEARLIEWLRVER